MTTRSLLALATIATAATFADAGSRDAGRVPSVTRVDVPSIGSLSPTSTTIGAGAMRLTVNGANFARNSVVRWNGSDRPTTFVSATQLHADIPPSDLTAVGARQVTVFTQGGNGGTSNPATFTIGNPVPTIASIAPTQAILGGEPFTLVVTGGNFVGGASVRWNGAPRPTTFEGPGRLTANISAADLGTAGSVQVTVFNPAPLGGSSSSTALPVTLMTPVIGNLTPGSRSVLAAIEFTLRVSGQNFLRSGSVVRWNGSPRPTTWISPTQVNATIPATDTDTAGVAQVTVGVTANGTTRESTAATFNIVNPPPTVISHAPYYAVLGEDTEFSIRGTFVRGLTKVSVNGAPAGVAVTTSQIYATVPRSAADAVGKTVTIQITTPGPGGGTASPTVTVATPRPYIGSLNPSTLGRGGAAFTLVVSGSRFLPGAVVRWNESDRSTKFVSATELRASIPATDLSVGGTAMISVVNPAPTAGPSSPKAISILETMIKVPD